MKESRTLNLGLRTPRIKSRNPYRWRQFQPFSDVTAELQKIQFCFKTRIEDSVGWMTLEMNLSQTFDTRGISKHQVKIISSAYRIINSSSAQIQTIFKLVLEDRHSLLVQVSVFGCGKGWQPLGRGGCFPEVILPAGERESLLLRVPCAVGMAVAAFTPTFAQPPNDLAESASFPSVAACSFASFLSRLLISVFSLLIAFQIIPPMWNSVIYINYRKFRKHKVPEWRKLPMILSLRENHC